MTEERWDGDRDLVWTGEVAMMRIHDDGSITSYHRNEDKRTNAMPQQIIEVLAPVIGPDVARDIVDRVLQADGPITVRTEISVRAGGIQREER